jgi:site-specific DNA-cytosine methylase
MNTNTQINKLRVLVACEYSGRVRDAFLALGHDAMSCDLLPTETPGPHFEGDVRDVINYPWDLMIAHPPCTHLSVSGARHFAGKRIDGRQQAAVSFFMALAKADIPCIAIENPVCIMSSLWRKPDQTIQPYQYGHGETKATCLWLKNLPLLKPTNQVDGREARVHRMPPGPDRWKNRSRTFEGIAHAMAMQWGGAVNLFEGTNHA